MEIHDEVHGRFQLPPHIAFVIKTPQFQRLQGIAQLGTMALSSPNAQHTRYDHCIGTYHLATRMLDALVTNSAWVADDDAHWTLLRQAVEIAGLLHDVGHGPFSHSWERVVQGFHHEENGLACVDAIFQQLPDDLLPHFRAHDDYGIALVKALIVGDAQRLPALMNVAMAPSTPNYIFEIVNNKRCGLDVDKWDYLKRDGHYLRSECAVNLNFDDVFLNARVANKGASIEYSAADSGKICDLYEARYQLQVHCYYRSVNIVCDEILSKLVENCEHTIAGRSLCEINSSHMDAFLQMQDAKVLELISDDKDFRYLHDCSNIEISDRTHTRPQRYSEKTIKINGPGCEMPPDDKFRFYGDERPIIKRNNDCVVLRVAFALP